MMDRALVAASHENSPVRWTGYRFTYGILAIEWQGDNEHLIPWELMFVVGARMLRATRRGFSGTFIAHCMRNGVVVVFGWC